MGHIQIITFYEITDPETLSEVIKILKGLFSRLSIDGVPATSLKCIKCGKDYSVPESEFCNRCGARLSTETNLFDDSLYPDKDIAAGKIIFNPIDDMRIRYENLRKRIVEYKPSWDKTGVIQYKTEYIAILQLTWGMQVEFIIAFDDLTREGYRLMAVDEGKSGGDSSGGFTGGVNAYFYFQNMKYVK
jgi:hypothetical protein